MQAARLRDTISGRQVSFTNQTQLNPTSQPVFLNGAGHLLLDGVGVLQGLSGGLLKTSTQLAGLTAFTGHLLLQTIRGCLCIVQVVSELTILLLKRLQARLELDFKKFKVFIQ